MSPFCLRIVSQFSLAGAATLLRQVAVAEFALTFTGCQILHNGQVTFQVTMTSHK